MTPRPTMSHLESETEEFLRVEVRKIGGYAFKWVPTIAGVPDRMCLLPGGRTVFVELKQEGERPTTIQEIWHSRLRAIGFTVVVLDSKDAVRTWIATVT